jgi:hypothetical protein
VCDLRSLREDDGDGGQRCLCPRTWRSYDGLPQLRAGRRPRRVGTIGSTRAKEGSVRLSGVGQAFCSVCSLILIRRMAEDCKEAFSVALESAKATHGRKEVE